MEKIELENERERLEKLSVDGLRAEFSRVVGWKSRSRNRVFLIRKILWYRQVGEGGDLSELARNRARAIADFRDLYQRLPAAPKPSTGPSGKVVRKNIGRRVTSPMPVAGSVLVREYQGKQVKVQVLAHGFEWSGRLFKSLSAVAREVTGTRWNGRLFFGLKR